MKSRLEQLEEQVQFIENLLEEAAQHMREQLQTKKPERKRKEGWTLQPGPDTPLWNELVRHAAANLRKRGDKVKLARLLGLPRQRLHQLLVSRTACADAERTLLLLAWVAARRAGQEWS